MFLAPNIYRSMRHGRWLNPVTNSAEGATYISHGCSPWLLIPNPFPGFGRKYAIRENKASPKRLDDDFFTENLWVF
jgi:hypothetical protein